jgi:hypothetical protein
MNWNVTLMQADKACPPPTEFSGAYISGGQANTLLLPDAYREAIAYAFGGKDIPQALDGLRAGDVIEALRTATVQAAEYTGATGTGTSVELLLRWAEECPDATIQVRPAEPSGEQPMTEELGGQPL